MTYLVRAPVLTLYNIRTRTIESVLDGPVRTGREDYADHAYFANPVRRFARRTHIDAAMRISATTPTPKLMYRMSCNAWAVLVGI